MTPPIEIERSKCDSFRTVLWNQVVHIGKNTEPNEKTLLLLASILKLREQARAALLLSESGFVEEILSTSRTMCEAAINAAYLQIAEDEEFERFKHFDTQSLYKMSGKLKRLGTVLDAEASAAMDSAVAHARSQTAGRQDKDLSWSIRQLAQRAEVADHRIGTNIFESLMSTAYSWSHRAVHATFGAVSPFYEALQTGTIPLTGDRLHDLEMALNNVNFVLHTEAGYLEHTFHTGMGRDILRITQSA